MQEFNHKTLERIEKKLEITKQNAIRYRNMAYKYRSKVKLKSSYKVVESCEDVLLKINPNTGEVLPDNFDDRYKLHDGFNNKYNRLNECLDFWLWDKYTTNKLLDLKKVNRCMDRFCPNCRSVSISQALVNFSPKFSYMIEKGYKPFIITLTVPNVPGEELEKTIINMNKSFTKFNRWFNKDLNEKGSYKNRLFSIPGMVKALEVTVQKDNWNMYHPHFHCIAFLKVDDLIIFKKYIDGPFSYKKKEYIKYSDADIQIMKLWKFAFDNIRITKYDDYPNHFKYDEEKDKYLYYQCDIRELLSEKGIYEVFKYTFKDSDIHTQKNFEDLYFALYKKRLRQGHGELFNLELDCDGVIDKSKESLEEYLLIDKKETPEQLITREIQNLNTDYHDYKKISRFKGAAHTDKIN